MSATVDRTHQPSLPWVSPFHAVLLAGTVPLFLGALLTDIAYASTYQIQWINFAAWLIVGGLVLGAFTILFALIDMFRGEHRGGRALAYLFLLLVTWGVGFINVLIHAKDAWAAMPAGLVLSVIVFLCACVATWMGFASLRARAGR